MVTRSPVALIAASWDGLARQHLVDGARGVIHSVFDRALNLTTDDGELVGLAGPGAGNGPATVVLAASPLRTFPSSGLVPGQPWSVRERRLLFGDALIAVSLSPARDWYAAGLAQRHAGEDGGAKNGAEGGAATGVRGGAVGGASAHTVVAEEVLDRLRRAEQAASAAAPVGGLAALLPRVESLVVTCTRRAGPALLSPDGQPKDSLGSPGAGQSRSLASGAPVVQRAVAAADDLVYGWLVGDPARVTAAATRLSGLGPGLTPSGDDLLAGFLVGIARASGQCEPALTSAVVSATAGRTTDVAAARVRHAAHGLIEERMEDVLAALLTGDGAELGPAIRRAATWGHTSGTDTLVGLFLGLRLGVRDPVPTVPPARIP